MKVFIQGHYYLNNNYGDELIEKAVKKQFEIVFKELNIPFELVGGEDDYDLFVLGGGGMYSDWQPEAPYTWLPPIRKALANGKPCIGYGIGVGPLTDCKPFHELFKQFKFITVRDSMSMVYMPQMPNACITADPVGLYNSFDDTKIPTCLINLVDQKTIPEFRKWCEEFVSYIKIMFDAYHHTLWEPHKVFCEGVVSNNKSITCEPNLFIGMQMHGIMTYALRYNIKTVAMIYHHKCNLPLDNIIAKINVGDGRQWPVLDTPIEGVKKIIKAMPNDLRYKCRASLNMTMLKNYLKGESNGRTIAISDYLN